MAEPSSTAAKPAVTPAKLILVGVLAVILVAVVYWNYFRSPSAPTGNPTRERGDERTSATGNPTRQRGAERPAPSARGPSAALTPDHPRNPPKAWPEYHLAEVLSHDPFAWPAQFPQPAEQVAEAAGPSTFPQPSTARATAAGVERAATLAALKQHGVRLVLRSGQEYVAKIGDVELRVGDKIGGLKVVDISLDGVTLEGDESP